MADGWRYFAQRFDGEGAGEFLDLDVPLAGVNIEDVLTGDNLLSGTISPEYAKLVGPDGRPIFEEWGTALYAEHEGVIRGGGLLNHSGFNGPDWTLEAVGFTGYAQDMPYTDANFFVEADPMDIFRHIWSHLQTQPGGDLDFQIANTKSPVRIGVAMNDEEFDVVDGNKTFESSTYKLAWYQDHNLSDNLSGLAADTPFDWLESHHWDGDQIRHVLTLGYPKIGRRRNDLRFVIGENVHVVPSVERDGAIYASDALVLGAGEGRKMRRGLSPHRPTGRLRRVAVVSDSNLRTQLEVDKRAEREVAWRNRLDDVTDITVTNHPHAPIGAVGVGDEIRLQGRVDWIDVDLWVRVLSRSIQPDDGDSMRLSVARTDRLSS